MTSVDNRVVEMQFDNKQFENGIQTSTKSLDNLKRSLDLSGAARGLSDLDRAGRSFSLAGISSGVDALIGKFSALSVMGVTALANITTAALHAGTQLIKSLTIDPVTTGFQEYETKMGAIQTILTNTQGGQKKVSQEAIAAINATASEAVKKSAETNAQSLDNLRESQADELDTYRETAKEELEIVQQKWDDEKDAVERVADAELASLEKAHQEKLTMYDEEYMAKLKVIDEERYNKVKAIDDEINAINAQTKAEQEALDKQAQQERIAALETRVASATTDEDRLAATKALNDYRAKIERDSLLKQRDLQIDQLKAQKDTINEEYNNLIEQLKVEYTEKQKNENELYKLQVENLKKEKEAVLKTVDETFSKQKEQLAEQQEAELKKISKTHAAELKAMGESQAIALKNIEARKQADIQALSEGPATKGSSLEEINAALAELNTYADKTIYNFADMTKNIGTFTAAGVGLEDSVMAIKGIANLAAGSGSSAQQASVAMYQLSQALAAGKVQLMDWNSVVNAGMGGQLFQNALKTTAKEMGINIDASKSFRESLQDGWLTADVLITTLGKLSKDESLLQAATQVKTFSQLLSTMKESVQSGWAVSWENIIGDKDESAATLTAINDAFSNLIGPAEAARNSMLQFWNDNGGRTAIIEAFTNAFNGLMSILKPIGEAFREIFPPMTGERLVQISQAIRDLTRQFKIGEVDAENIKKTFAGLFAVLDMGKQVFTFLCDAFGLVLKAIWPASGGILNFTGNIGDFLVSLDESLKKSTFFSDALTGIGKVIEFVVGLVKTVTTEIGKVFDGVSSGLSPILTTVGDTLASWVESCKESIKNSTLLSDALSALKDSLSWLGDKITVVLGVTLGFLSSLFTGTTKVAAMTAETDKLGESIQTTTNWFDKIKETIAGVAKKIKDTLSPVFKFIGEKLEGLSLGDVGAALTGVGFLTFAKTLSSGLKSFDKILKNFSKILTEVGDTLKAFQLKVKADALLKVAIALAVLAAALIALSFIKIEDLGKALAALSIVFIELVAGLAILSKLKDIQKMTGILIGIGACMLLLAFAIKTISSIKIDQLAASVAAIEVLMLSIAMFIKGTKEGDLAASSGGMIAFAIGITILAGALAILGALKPQALIQGGAAIIGLMTAIGIFIKGTKGGDLAASAGGMMGFAIGIAVLAGALAILGKLKVATLQQGAIAIVGLMTAIGVFIQATKEGDLAASAGGMMGFAIGIAVLVGALVLLGKLKMATLQQGAIAIVSLMTAIGVFIQATKEGDLAASAGGLIGFAFGIGILVGSIVLLSGLNLGQVTQGVGAIAALMGAIMLFVKFSKEGDLGKSAAGLAGFAAGILILSAAVFALAVLPFEKLVQGTVAIAALIVVIALFVNLTRGGDLAKSATGLVGFATGLAILAGVIALLSALNTEKLLMASAAIGVMMLAIATFIKVTNGKKLMTGAVGMVAFAGAIYLLAQALVPLTSLNIQSLLGATVALVALMGAVVLFNQLTNGATLMTNALGLTVFSVAIGILAAALTVLGAMDTTALLIGMAAIAGTFVILGVAGLVLGPITPIILALSAAVALLGVGCLAAGTGMLAFSSGIAILATAGQAGVDVFIAALRGLIEQIPFAMQKIAEGIVAFATVIVENGPVITQAMITLLTGIIDAIVVVVPKAVEAIMKLITALLDALVVSVPKMVDSGMKLVTGILTGIANNIEQVVEAGIDVILNFIKGVTDKIPDIIDAAFKVIIAFINGLADAISGNSDAILDACGNLITAIVDALLSFGSKLIDAGKNLIQGLIDGVGQMAGALWDKVVGVVSSAFNGLLQFLGIASPSKRAAEVGEYMDLGFVVGLNRYAKKVSVAAIDVGKTAVGSLRDAISNISNIVNDGMSTDPVIRPILDLSDVETGGKRIGQILSQRQGLNVGAVNSKIPVIGQSSQNGGINPQQDVQKTSGQPISFVQNNYSPKALSRLEIYRQTNNQLSRLKGLVEAR